MSGRMSGGQLSGVQVTRGTGSFSGPATQTQCRQLPVSCFNTEPTLYGTPEIIKIKANKNRELFSTCFYKFQKVSLFKILFFFKYMFYYLWVNFDNMLQKYALNSSMTDMTRLEIFTHNSIFLISDLSICWWLINEVRLAHAQALADLMERWVRLNSQSGAHSANWYFQLI